MRAELIKHASYHAHRDELTGRLGFLHNFTGDRFNRMHRFHAANCASRGTDCLGIVLTFCAASLNTYSELQQYWCAILGLNQVMH
jgi:hypothetical protein